MSYPLAKALQLIALRDVMQGTIDYHLRYVFRWYSRTFATPLHVVSGLPLDHVLQHFYECKYEDMDEHEREEERKRLLQSEKERLEETIAEERRQLDDLGKAQEDDEYFRRAEQEAALHNKKTEDKKPEPEQWAIPKAPSLEQGLKPGDKLPPDIQMVFTEREKLDEMVEAIEARTSKPK